MRFLLPLLALCLPTLAHGRDSTTLHVSVSLTGSTGHRLHVGVEAGASHAFGWDDLSPSASARVRLLFDQRGPVLPQIVVAGGAAYAPVAPVLALEGELGVVFAGRRPCLAYGASAWSAPIPGLSPRLGLAWTSFRSEGEPHDLLQASLGPAVVAVVQQFLWLPDPSPPPPAVGGSPPD